MVIFSSFGSKDPVLCVLFKFLYGLSSILHDAHMHRTQSGASDTLFQVTYNILFFSLLTGIEKQMSSTCVFDLLSLYWISSCCFAFINKRYKAVLVCSYCLSVISHEPHCYC